jgi:hypothetical protein
LGPDKERTTRALWPDTRLSQTHAQASPTTGRCCKLTVVAVLIGLGFAKTQLKQPVLPLESDSAMHNRRQCRSEERLVHAGAGCLSPIEAQACPHPRGMPVQEMLPIQDVITRNAQ